jgi:hypothetical protein
MERHSFGRGRHWFVRFLAVVSHDQEHLKKQRSKEAKKQLQHAFAFFELLFS